MRLRSSWAAFAALLLLVSPLRAQELSLLVVRATSPNAELPAPMGFSLTGTVAVYDWLFDAAFVRYTDATFKPGVVCRVYSPRIDCGPEEVHTSTALGGLRLAVQRAVRLGEPVRFGLGGGLSFNALSGTADGQSGRRADLHVPNGGQIGYLGLLSLDVAPVPKLPLHLRTSYASHWVRFRGCVDPEDPTASTNVPFCGNDRFNELSVGITWVMPGA
jgi:hypothetical protein